MLPFIPPNLDYRPPTGAPAVLTIDGQPIDSPSAPSASSENSASPAFQPSTSDIPHPTSHIPPARRIPPLSFDPPEQVIKRIVSDLGNAEISLSEIARAAGTDLESLSIFLARPEISARVDAVESTFARRCRFNLANRSAAIMNACSGVIDNFNYANSHLTFRDNDLKGHALLTRNATNALLAGRMLIHLAKHFTQAATPTRLGAGPDNPKSGTGISHARDVATSPHTSPHSSPSTNPSRPITTLPPLPSLNLRFTPTPTSPTESIPTPRADSPVPPDVEVGGAPQQPARPPQAHAPTIAEATNAPLAPDTRCPPKPEHPVARSTRAPAAAVAALPLNIRPSPIVPLTISARSLIEAAGQPRPRAP